MRGRADADDITGTAAARLRPAARFLKAKAKHCHIAVITFSRSRHVLNRSHYASSLSCVPYATAATCTACLRQVFLLEYEDENMILAAGERDMQQLKHISRKMMKDTMMSRQLKKVYWRLPLDDRRCKRRHYLRLDDEMSMRAGIICCRAVRRRAQDRKFYAPCPPHAHAAATTSKPTMMKSARWPRGAARRGRLTPNVAYQQKRMPSRHFALYKRIIIEYNINTTAASSLLSLLVHRAHIYAACHTAARIERSSKARAPWARRRLSRHRPLSSALVPRQ